MKLSYQNIALFSIIGSLLVLVNCQQGQKHTSALASFQIHPSFKMELVASEPLIFDPVDMKFDEKGQAYVLEMPGYPFSESASSLILLKDKNGDGQYEERQVFATGLGVASSFMPYEGGFLVAAPPNLIWLKDTDGDNVADLQEAVMAGFEVGNLQHNYNGLTYGLDNWIYAANGGNNGNPHFIDTPNQALDLRGQDFRFRLKDKRLERVGKSSGGYELTFDNWGNMYETHNLEHVSQLVFEGRYLEGVPVEPKHSLHNISDHEENGLSRIYPIGEQETRVNHPEQSGYFSGSCGITFYGGNAFPDGFNNQLFVADVVLNLIHLDALSPNIAAFKTSRKQEKAEFVASTDRSFRPVNMTTGPDGALYVLDIHRAVIEHPEWIPDEIEKTMDLEAGKDKGRIYKITPKMGWSPTKIPFDKAQPQTLVKALTHKNQWTRMTAQRLMVSTANKNYIPLLENLLTTTDNALAQLHVLWTLEGLNSLKNELLIATLEEKAAGLRVNAIKIAEKRLSKNPELIKKLMALANDENAQVRMQVALSLSTLPKEQYFQHQSAIAQTIRTILQHKEVDIWIAMAAAAATKNQAINFAENLLNLNQPLNEHSQEVVLTLSRLVGQQNRVQAVQRMLVTLSNNSTINEAFKTDIIEALATGWSKNAVTTVNNQQIVSLLEKIEKGKEPAIVHACSNLRLAMKLPISASIHQQIIASFVSVKNAALPVEKRMKLLKLIELANFSERAPILYSLLDNSIPLALQEEALWQLWRSNDPSVATILVDKWSTLGPAARKKASDILLYKSYHHKTLLGALETGKINIGEMNFDLERRRTLLWWSDSEEVKSRASALFSDAGVVTRKAAIEKMRPALTLTGDVGNGRLQFENLCSQCHQYKENGKNVGPVLTEIGRKSKETLLYDILDPNAAVDTKYINHQAKLKDGSIHTGIIAQESDKEVVLKNLGGQEVILNKLEIEQLSSLGTSLMPEGQEVNMSEQDMADLLAFLQQSVM